MIADGKPTGAHAQIARRFATAEQPLPVTKQEPWVFQGDESAALLHMRTVDLSADWSGTHTRTHTNTLAEKTTVVL